MHAHALRHAPWPSHRGTDRLGQLDHAGSPVAGPRVRRPSITLGVIPACPADPDIVEIVACAVGFGAGQRAAGSVKGQRALSRPGQCRHRWRVRLTPKTVPHTALLGARRVPEGPTSGGDVAVLLLLSLLSPVLMAGLLTAAVRMERRLDGFWGGDREERQPPKRARQHHAARGLTRAERSTRREDRHGHLLQPGRLGLVVGGDSVDDVVEPAWPKHLSVSSRRRRAHLRDALRVREQLIAGRRAEPFEGHLERVRRGVDNGLGRPG